MRNNGKTIIKAAICRNSIFSLFFFLANLFALNYLLLGGRNEKEGEKLMIGRSLYCVSQGRSSISFSFLFSLSLSSSSNKNINERWSLFGKSERKREREKGRMKGEEMKRER